jgi:DNA-binding SARP family transcriptional activator
VDYRQYMKSGQYYKSGGQWAQAIYEFQQALLLKPRDEAALREIISGFYDAGEPAQALQTYEDFARWLAEADEKPEEETKALYMLLHKEALEKFYGFMRQGMQYTIQRKFQEALAEFVSAMTFQPMNESLVSALMSTLDTLHRFDEAARIYERYADALQHAKEVSPDPLLTQLYFQIKVKGSTIKK